MVRTATMPHSLPRTCPAGRTAASPDALRRKAAACAGPGATGPGRHGARVIRPWLRGFGPTRFLSAATVRSGQQAALGSDLIALLDALRLDTAILAGYDWGGLSSCVAAALLDESTFDQSAASFDNPDFVDVVIHAYRHSFGLAEGDPAYEELEGRVARRPAITVPAVTLDGISDPLKPGGTADSAGMFTARHERRVVDVGHDLPQEAPAAFADAVLTVRKWLSADDQPAGVLYPAWNPR